MKLFAKQNRELIMINAQNTQNENDAEKITLQVPEQYENFNKKIVFVTPDGNVWDIITNNEYLIPKAITKYKQVDLYIWLTKGDVDFRSKTRTLKFYQNVDASDEITDEEIGRVNTVVNLLEEEITKVENLESQIDGKLEEVDTAIDNIHTAIQETENLDLDAEKVGQTTTITLTKKDGTVKTVHVDDGVDLQFMWQGTSLGIKTAEQEQYTFVNLQGVQGPAGPQGEPFTIKKTYSSVAEMNADFNNMQLGDYVMIASTVEVEDNAKLYTRGENEWIFITDFSGATGIRGETGLTPNIQIGAVTQGSSFNVTRTGTNENPVLNFTLVKGDKGDRGIQGIQGLTGNGISSITKTGTSGLVDTYTITYTNGNTTTFTVTNGEDANTTDISKIKEEITALQAENSRLKGITNALPKISGEDTSLTLTNTANTPFNNIILKGNTTQNGEPTPATPQDINVVTGNNTITISNSDNTEKQELPISLGSLELCKIGDYQDYIYKNNGKWYKHKVIDKIVLNGDMNWIFFDNKKEIGIKSNSVIQISNALIPVTDSTKNETPLFSSHFVKGTQTIVIKGYNFIGFSKWGNDIYLYLPNDYDSIDTAKKWLNTNKPIVYYAISTPIEEEIIDTTLISQLNALYNAYTYNDTTNITQTNANLPFYINAEAFKKIS